MQSNKTTASLTTTGLVSGFSDRFFQSSETFQGLVYSSTEMGIFMPYFVSGEISFSVGAERMW